ncbi:MAG: DUF5666 domain-containing protein [Chloroflexi bacterium]|nr:DUF5666 domain-containing protein [Chloroflexota bacterium]
MKKAVIFLMMLFALGAACFADEINGKVQAVDINANTIIISGIKISAQHARLENEADMPIILSAITVGDFLDVEGTFTGNGQMMAMKIEKDYPGYDKIKGKIDKIDYNTREMIIAGVKIKVSQDAWLEGPHDMIFQFAQFVPSSYVECKGRWTGPLEFNTTKVEMD